MDTTATVTDIAPETGEATVKEDAQGTQGTESVASGNGERAGGEQSTTEGSQEEGQAFRQRGPTKLDTIRELRAKLRDRDQNYSSQMEALKSQIEEMKGMIASGRQGQKPSKTFWEAPEETTRSILEEQMKALKEELLNDFNQTRQQDQKTTEWKQETSEAAKFIQTQKGLTSEDHEDIAEIVRATPEMQTMRPLQRAKYALYLWKEERGITDKSALKARASTTSGAPVTGGARTWTKSEIEGEINKFPVDPGRWTPEQTKAYETLEAEWKLAFKENRVK